MPPCAPVAPTCLAQGDTARAAPAQLHRDSSSAQLGALRGALLRGCSIKTQPRATFWSWEAERDETSAGTGERMTILRTHLNDKTYKEDATALSNSAVLRDCYRLLRSYSDPPTSPPSLHSVGYFLKAVNGAELLGRNQTAAFLLWMWGLRKTKCSGPCPHQFTPCLVRNNSLPFTTAPTSMARDGRARSVIYYSRVLGARQQAQHRASSTPCLSGHHFPCQNVAWDELVGCLRAARRTGCPVCSTLRCPEVSLRPPNLTPLLPNGDFHSVLALFASTVLLPRCPGRTGGCPWVLELPVQCHVFSRTPLPTSLVAAEMLCPLTGAILLLGHLPTAPLDAAQPAPATDVCLRAVFQGGMNYTQGASFQRFPLPVAYGG